MNSKISYTYEEALEASTKYFNDNELSARVFVDKYALRDNSGNILEKTPADMHRRIASEFARIEKKKFKKPMSAEKIFGYLDQFAKIIPQGSPMYGIGNPYQYITLSNCYVIEPPLDSYGSIHRTDEQLTQISKRRGGVGTDISHLRPSGTPTTNSARSSTGIIPFMERYSNSIREVGQAARRGALMLSISVHHPEIVAFAKCKRNLEKITGANISIRLTNEFLKAVEENKEYEQRWPVDEYSAKQLKVKFPTISKRVMAREVWHEIISNAHAMAEPGLLFWDRIISESVGNCYAELGFRDVGCNPCLRSSTKILTKDGISTIGNIKIGDEIWSTEGWTKIINKWSTGVKKVYRYGTTAGCFYGTENHRIVSRGEKVEVKDAESIDIFTGPYDNDITIDPQDIMDGLVIGDGSVHKERNKVHLCVGEKDYDYFNSEIKHLINSKNSHYYRHNIKSTIAPQELPYTYLRKIPDRFIFGNRNKICGFLRGLYSANGSICGERVTLKATSFKIIEDVQLMLSSIGIRSYYTTNKSTTIKFKNGEYTCKRSYDLNITTDRTKFQQCIGFIQQYKNEELQRLINSTGPSYKTKKTYDIISVDFVSEEEVFDITVDNSSHTYWTQCCNVSNCSELVLPNGGSCLLLLLNLFGYVKNPFTKEAYFDFNEFYQDAQVAQRLMDDLVDLEIEATNKIIDKINNDSEPENIKYVEISLWKSILEKCLNGRRTGTGITALGDTIASIGLKYGSKESIEFTDKLFKTLKFGVYQSSIDMAEELGAFPVWNHQLEKDNPFINRIKNETLDLDGQIISGADLFDKMAKVGRRNIAMLTCPPAGSVSILAKLANNFGSSSGIEPQFTIEPYIRRKKGNPGDQNFRTDFIDQNGDRWQEFKVYPGALIDWQSISKETDTSKSPWHKACANDIDWKNRVELQATAQKHIDHAISSTINLPNNVTVDKVKEIYETAWKLGCKGITIYRDGCRTGVLVKEEAKQEQKQQERPKTLPCDIHHIKVTKRLDKIRTFNYLVLVGLMDNRPYEVFITEDTGLNKKYVNGNIIRVKNGHYNLELPDNVVLENVTKNTCDYEDCITRLTSTSLRYGADIGFIVTQLEKSEGDMWSLGKALSRALKHYIKDGTIVKEKCPNCGAETMVRNSGCATCNTCGYSKCS